MIGKRKRVIVRCDVPATSYSRSICGILLNILYIQYFLGNVTYTIYAHTSTSVYCCKKGYSFLAKITKLQTTAKNIETPKYLEMTKRL